MKKIGLVALVGAALLAFAYAVPAQQTLMGVCSGTVGVITQATGLGNVYCTPAVTLPPPAPTVTIAANPAAINPGQSSTLAWGSNNATACAASSGWTGSEPLSGTQSVSPAVTSTYILTCTSAGGSASASASVTVASAPPPSGCSLSSPAFCETFNAGPVANNGRTGDLDPAKWTASRLSGEIAAGIVANPQFVASIPACRATFTGTMVYSPNDTLICDPSGTKTAQLMTAAAIQNYGTNNYMILQPFDFAGRTGKIDFDVDAAVQSSASGYTEVDITDQPVPAPTFREFNNFEVGSLPQNAIIVKFLNCGNTPSAAPSNVMVYNNYVGTILTPTVNGGCVQTATGSLNHFEIQLSQTQISIYGADFSPDNVTFPNYKLLYQATINLPFSRGYVHIAARNHATLKYAGVLAATFHWDNIGFDGPVIPALKAYEIPDNTTVSTFTGDAGDPATPAINLGYLLQDGTNGKAAGMYDPVNLIPSFSFQNVNLSGAASAQLTFNAWFNAASNGPNDTAHIATTAWGISYSLNGGPFTTVFLTPAQIAAMSNNTGSTGPGVCCIQGYFTPVVNVPLSALVQGMNTVRFLPVGAPMDYAPVITNIDLLLTAGSAPPPLAPTVTLGANPSSISPGQSSTLAWASTNATACIASGGWSGSESLNGSLAVSPLATVTYILACSGAGGSAQASASVTVLQQQTSNCGMILGGTPIFCEPFDVVNAGTPSRTGDLDPNVWGVSRTTGFTNFGVGSYNGWTATANISLCDGTTPAVAPPHDVQICNGQLREATNDNPSGVFDAGNVLVLAMYPKQPFDFAGRTGTVSFDVSNDSTGTHSAWPEFWMTDLPIPAPFNHFDSWQTLPANGFGIRFAAMVGPGGGGSCPNNNNLDKPRWTVDSAVVVRNYVMDDTNGSGGVRTNMTLTETDCVISSSGPGDMNHIELRISQGGIDVYATDAGVAATPTTLRKIATITNANLSLTRGLVWLEDAHYNADKGVRTDWPVPSQRNHTFSWDNLAFDGPFTYRDFSYDALDVGVVDTAMNTIDLGKFSDAGQGSSWNVAGMPANPQGTAVRVLFNFNNIFQPIPTAINVTVNGHAHTVGWPYPDMIQNTWRTFAVTVPITDLVAGTNVVTIGMDQAAITSNVNIVLVDVPGGAPVLPGNSRAYPN